MLRDGFALILAGLFLGACGSDGSPTGDLVAGDTAQAETDVATADDLATDVPVAPDDGLAGDVTWGTATLDAPAKGTPGEPLPFLCHVNGTAKPAAFEFDWNGDGTADQTGPADGKATHTWWFTATWKAACRATDGQGGTGPWSAAVEVAVAATQGPLDVTLTAGAPVTSTFPTTGGTLQATTADGATLTLEIEAGALTDATVLTVEPVTTVAGTPLSTVFGAARFGPAGTVFLKPAKLTLHTVQPLPTDPVVGFETDDQGHGFHLVPAERVDANTLRILVVHFTTVGGGSTGTQGPGPSLTHATPTTEGEARQAIAAIVSQAGSGGWDPLLIAQVLRDWYDLAVGPNLHSAASHPDDMESAFVAWASWQALCHQFGVDMGVRDADARTALIDLIEAAIVHANERCSLTGDWAWAIDGIAWFLRAQSLGLSGLPDLAITGFLADFCVKAQIAGWFTPPELDPLNGGQFFATPSYTLGAQDQRFDHPFAVTVAAQGGSITPASMNVPADGQYEGQAQMMAGGTSLEISVHACLQALGGLVCADKTFGASAAANCGASGQPCCANNQCTSGLQCVNSQCVPASTCGAQGQACCTSGSPCQAGLLCGANQQCAPSATCGNVDQSCCANQACVGGAVCDGIYCVPCGAETQPCCTGGTSCESGLECLAHLGNRCQKCGTAFYVCCDNSVCHDGSECSATDRCECGTYEGNAHNFTHQYPCCSTSGLPNIGADGCMTLNSVCVQATCSPCGYFTEQGPQPCCNWNDASMQGLGNCFEMATSCYNDHCMQCGNLDQPCCLANAYQSACADGGMVCENAKCVCHMTWDPKHNPMCWDPPPP